MLNHTEEVKCLTLCWDTGSISDNDGSSNRETHWGVGGYLMVLQWQRLRESALLVQVGILEVRGLRLVEEEREGDPAV